ncbi:hypothetical protein LOK74_14980 [Brevibacillus humidisoli]|uniref:hypothetical protein n=1 Tax=Brevibacillus humidisoli TaxID=2895522 RepID=UPI001E4CBE31|nr:hypothetical protein [Brevibacillus humidisoli]UFJ39371.1 hypothetical protein LOK74_14980 [Brevibacillus humidisoli]
MERLMVYYFAWQEDEWLDEILDYFSEVNALVPTQQTLELVKEQRREEGIGKSLIIVNTAGEPEKSGRFLDLLTQDDTLADAPLYIVGVSEREAADWQQAYPRAKVVAITGFAVEFDYTRVLAGMESAWEEVT